MQAIRRRDFTSTLAVAPLNPLCGELTRTLQSKGTDAMTHERVALAWQHHCEGAYPEVETLCREILREDPVNVGAWRLLGEACLFQCLYKDAVEAYRQARRRIQLAPGDLNNLGVALAAQDSPAEAEEVYREALGARA